jgi:hypothetical protein
MGAAGSIVTNAQGEVNIATNPNVEPPSKAPSKTSQAINMKSKFPSIIPPPSPGQVVVKKDKNPTFKVTLAYTVPFIRDLQPFKIYLLRVSQESLDIISEGENKIKTRQDILFAIAVIYQL